MEIEFDPGKDLINQEKHGLSLAAAAKIVFEDAVIVKDERFDYGETRYIAYAPLDGRLCVVWYTKRGKTIRVIGLRKANERERKRRERPS